MRHKFDADVLFQSKLLPLFFHQRTSARAALIDSYDLELFLRASDPEMF